MFTKQTITLIENPECVNPALDLNPQDFQYYDKDGFELNLAEQKFYSAMSYPITYPILNHCCWQEPWLTLNHDTLILDHCMFLCRASYNGLAVEQLQQVKSVSYLADYLLRTKQKWGFDFALDAVSTDGTAYEVLHIEYDSYNFEEFVTELYNFEKIIQNTDWTGAAANIWNTRELWRHLTGFEQNHWKAQYLLGWTKSEYTEKSV
jgi:hypothetical protein